MRKAIYLIFCSIFVTIAVFGFIGMVNSSGSMDYCIAATSGKAVPCPMSQSGELAQFHINAFKSFSLTTLTTSVLLILFAAVLIISLSILFKYQFFILEPAYISVEKKLLSEKDIVHWHSLHETSPTILYMR